MPRRAKHLPADADEVTIRRLHRREAVGQPVGSERFRVGSHWVRTDGTYEAAWSGSADVVTLWPASARETGVATYRELRRFKEKCPCQCPGPNGTWLPTSVGEPAPDREILRILSDKFPRKGGLD